MALLPTSSRGGGGPAAGSYLPVGTQAGVTLDTTTYSDPVAGGGAKLATLVFASEGSAFAIAQAGDTFPRWLFTSDPRDGVYFSGGSVDPYTGGASIYEQSGAAGSGIRIDATAHNDNISLRCGATATLGLAGNATISDTGILVGLGVATGAITSGALPTVQLVTATGTQILAARDVETITPCTFNPGAATTATVTVALSPDNVTYSTLGVETEPAGVAFDGTIHLIKVRVPAGWYLKLTVNAQAVLGLTTYY